MAHPHHCLVTEKLRSTYFNVLYAYFIIGPNVRSHYVAEYKDVWTQSRCQTLCSSLIQSTEKKLIVGSRGGGTRPSAPQLATPITAVV